MEIYTFFPVGDFKDSVPAGQKSKIKLKKLKRCLRLRKGKWIKSIDEK